MRTMPPEAACGTFDSFAVENWLHTVRSSLSSLEQMLGLLLKFAVSDHSNVMEAGDLRSSPISLIHIDLF